MLQEPHSPYQIAHLYTPCDQISTDSKSKSFEDVFTIITASDQFISDVYSYINELILAYKTNSEQQYKQTKQWKQKIFFEFKSNLFYKYYSCEKTLNNQAKQNLHMFDLTNLFTLFTEVLRIRDHIKPLIYKLSGVDTRTTKINGYLAIARLQTLLKEIINTAFPYELYPSSEAELRLYNEIKLLTPNQIKNIALEKDDRQKFRFVEFEPLKMSLLDIDDQIQSIQMANRKEEEKLLSTDNLEYSQTLGHINIGKKELDIDYLEYMKFQHRLFQFINSYTNKKITPSLEYLRMLMKEEPTNQIKEDKMNVIAFQLKEQPVQLSNYFIFLKNLIETLRSLNTENKEAYDQCVQQMLNIFDKWVILFKYSQTNLILIENYIVVLGMHREFDPTYCPNNSERLSSLFQTYIDSLLQYLMKQNSQAVDNIISLDEQLTYSLLTTKQIINTLVGYEQKFIDLVRYFAPILESLVEITSFAHQQHRSKPSYVDHIISSIHYPSQKDEGSIRTITKSKLKLNSVGFDVDVLLSFNHESLQRIKPYLREIKHTIMLLNIVKKDIANNTQEEYQDHLKLKEIAAYFYTQRVVSPIYELKAKLLLFISLFKMGFHHPIIREGDKRINLRIRIINLYNKLYSQNSYVNFELSLMQSVSDRRSSEDQNEEGVYDPQSFDLVDQHIFSSVIQEQPVDKLRNLMSSQQLETKITNFIVDNFVNAENNGKIYLISLMNILEQELFTLEQNSNDQRVKKTGKDYSHYLKNCLGVSLSNTDPEIQKLIDIEKDFFQQNYERAWKKFTNYKNDPQFATLVDNIDSVLNNSSILKFLRIYTLFEKMEHLFYKEQQRQNNIANLLQQTNNNNPYLISLHSIAYLYDIKEKEKKFNQYDEFYNNRLKEIKQKDDKYQQIKSEISLENVKIYKYLKPQAGKKQIKIQIGEEHKEHHKQLIEQLAKYYLFNQIGMYKVSQVKSGNSLVILLESNSFFIKNQANIFQTLPNSFEQNAYEKFCRKSLHTIIQSLHIFYSNQNSSYLLTQQIDFELDPLTFCINPYYGIIQSVLLQGQKKLEQHQKNIKNRDVIEGLVLQFISQFSEAFRENIYNFLHSLIESSKKKGAMNYNKLLQVPLFMTLQEKQMFIVYFDNKMSQLCDKFHDQQRKLLKEKKYIDAQKKRLTKMKESVYKSYSYHFVIGGVLESEMNILKICSEKMNNKLDWVSEHKNLMISYELPTKTNSQQLKDYVYSLNCFLKHLRGALAHKSENSYLIIANFNSEFPKLIDYLYSSKEVLESRFDEIMNNKNIWLRDYFNLNEKQLKRLRQIVGGNSLDQSQINSDITQAFQIIREHKRKYEKELRVSSKMKNYYCLRCNDLISFIKGNTQFIQFLRKLQGEMMKKSHILSVEHNMKDCLISQHFKNHRILSVFGGWSRKIEARHYLVMNWWFFLQTQFPNLIRSLDKLRYLIDQ